MAPGSGKERAIQEEMKSICYLLSHPGAEAPFFCGTSEQGQAPVCVEGGRGRRGAYRRQVSTSKEESFSQAVVPGEWTPVLAALGAAAVQDSPLKPGCAGPYSATQL